MYVTRDERLCMESWKMESCQWHHAARKVLYKNFVIPSIKYLMPIIKELWDQMKPFLQAEKKGLLNDNENRHLKYV